MATKRTKVKVASEYHFPPIERVMSDVEVFRIAGDLRSGNGQPEQAKSLIAQFVAAAYTEDGPSNMLITFVRDALAEYLAERVSMEVAFNLKQGRRGKPSAGRARHIAMAKEILRCRVVDGKTFEEAVESACNLFRAGRTVVSETFEKYKTDALRELSSASAQDLDPRSEIQRQRLAAIFPWFAPALPAEFG